MGQRTYKGGSPEHEPTPEKRQAVADFYLAGIPQARIASHLGINETTLVKYYRNEMDKNLDTMTTGLAKNLYQDALAGDKQAREFWLKTRARWSFARPDDDKKSVTESLLEKLIEKL